MDTVTPLRRSQRKIKKKELPRDERIGDSLAPKPWSRAEKAQLLAALEVFDDSDIASISEYVPTKTVQQIEYYIRSVKRKAVMICGKGYMVNELEKWTKLLSKRNRKVDMTVYDQFTIPLFLISLFENLPSPSVCDGVDFKAAYEFIFCIMAEIPPKAMNSKTLEFISKSFNEMGSMIAGNHDLKSYVLEKLKECDKMKESNEEVTDHLNPLNFPELNIPLSANDCDG